MDKTSAETLQSSYVALKSALGSKDFAKADKYFEKVIAAFTKADVVQKDSTKVKSLLSKMKDPKAMIIGFFGAVGGWAEDHDADSGQSIWNAEVACWVACGFKKSQLSDLVE